MSTVETAIGRFVWHDHISEDPEKARRFYSDLLGWETEIFKAGPMDYPMIMVGGAGHGGFGPSRGAPPHWMGSIGVEDVDAVAKQAEAAGASIVAEPMDIPEVGRLAVLTDPQGASFAIFASGSEEWTPAEGVFVWDELHTTDVEGAKRFYGEILGWSSTDRDMGGEFTYTIFDSNGEQRAGCMPVMQGGMPPMWMAYLGTDDVDATCRRAEELGAQKLAGPDDIPDVGRFAVLTDPTGAVFSLYKPAAS